MTAFSTPFFPQSFTLVSADVNYKPSEEEDEFHERYLQRDNQEPRHGKPIRIV